MGRKQKFTLDQQREIRAIYRNSQHDLNLTQIARLYNCSSATISRIVDGLGPCMWFALCDNPAVTTQAHPVLGDVAICQRCKDWYIGMGDCECGHPWHKHKRQANGAHGCTSFGCGCRDVVLPR